MSTVCCVLKPGVFFRLNMQTMPLLFVVRRTAIYSPVISIMTADGVQQTTFVSCSSIHLTTFSGNKSVHCTYQTGVAGQRFVVSVDVMQWQRGTG
jgi:hypothetical protein